MILAEKIISLRKQMGWSQEELAGQLSVSRQSVSKWELGASIPDLDKILKMSELFGVSTDYLLKDEMEQAEYSGGTENVEERSVSAEEADRYMRAVQGISGKIAAATALFIGSPIALIQLAAFSEIGKFSDNFAGGLGLIILLILVAIGVAICITQNMKVEEYQYLEREPITLQYGVSGIVEKKKQDFQNTYVTNLTIGVSMYIVGVIPLFVAAMFDGSDFVCVSCVSLLLVFVAVGTFLITRVGMIRGSYQKLLQQEDYSVENKETNRRIGYVGGVYWSIITAIYLGMSFVTLRWDRTWIIWPVAGVLYAAVHGIVGAVARKR